MKIFRFSRKEWANSFLLTLIFYIIFFYFFPDEIQLAHAKTIPVVLDIITLNLAALIAWRLNNLFADHFDKHYRWEERPIVRLIAQILITSLIAFGVIIVCMIPNALITHYLYPELMHNLEKHYLMLERVAYYFLAVLIIFQSVYIGGNFYKRWITSSLEAQNLKYENVHAQLHILQNQSQPHFLFNTLNTLVSLIEEDQKTAVEFVQQLSNFYRYILQKDEDHLARLDDEINFVNSYIFMQKKRFGDNLKIEIDVCENSNGRYLPVFVLLILFENAVKHNIISVDNPLYIKVFCKDDYLLVENNLQKKSSTLPSNGFGLSSIKNRYEILGRKDVQIIESDKTYSVKIPLLSENHYESINR